MAADGNGGGVSSGGASIGGGLIAMWVTYAVTQSTGLAWVAFFVVGGFIFYSVAPRSR